MEGAPIIKELITRQRQDYHNAGFRSQCRKYYFIRENTAANEFHSSAGIYIESKMKYQSPTMNESLKHIIVNKEVK